MPVTCFCADIWAGFMRRTTSSRSSRGQQVTLHSTLSWFDYTTVDKGILILSTSLSTSGFPFALPLCNPALRCCGHDDVRPLLRRQGRPTRGAGRLGRGPG